MPCRSPSTHLFAFAATKWASHGGVECRCMRKLFHDTWLWRTKGSTANIFSKQQPFLLIFQDYILQSSGLNRLKIASTCLIFQSFKLLQQ
jgi:hypothetical protein